MIIMSRRAKGPFHPRVSRAGRARRGKVEVLRRNEGKKGFKGPKNTIKIKVGEKHVKRLTRVAQRNWQERTLSHLHAASNPN
jgi:hypothetical protein